MKISIIGAAGTVGSATAFAIAVQGLADELVLMDTNENILRNHAMDINTAVSGIHNITVRAGSYEDLNNTDITIVSAGVHLSANMTQEDKIKPNIPVIKHITAKIEKFCPESLIIMVTNPIDVMNYIVHLSGFFSRKHLLGYNMNDSLRFCDAAAKALGVKATRVEGIAAGYHPVATVPLFSSLKIDGKPVSINEEGKKRIIEESRNYLRTLDSLGAKRTAGWTTAAGLTLMVKAIRDDARVVLPCSVILDGEYGFKNLSIGVPAIIGKEGISEIPEWDLPATERQELDKVADILNADCKLARELLESTGA